MSTAPRRTVGGGAPPAGRPVMDQVKREFVPSVLPVQVGTAVSFPNRDRPGVVALGCRIHDWMTEPARVEDTLSPRPLHRLPRGPGRYDGTPGSSEVGA